MKIIQGLSILFGLGVWLTAPARGEEEYDLMFVGDINLGRLVETEISFKKSSPWELVVKSEPRALHKVGNLEGAAGFAADCLSSVKFCLNFPPKNLWYAKEAGFSLLGQANNHAYDLADIGFERSKHEVSQQGMVTATLDESPYFITVKDVRYAIVFINRIPDARGKYDTLPSARISQALQLARTGANFVIVYIHWGEELRNWASESQRKDAQWLINHGADIIVGSHPHVIQPVECIADHPVWFSLGNHIFDQKYSDTHTGGMLACSSLDTLNCTGYQTQTIEGSAKIKSVTKAPELDTPDACLPWKRPTSWLKLDDYTISLGDSYRSENDTFIDLQASGNEKKFKLMRLPLIRLAPFHLPDNSKALFMLVKVYSDLDHTIGIRPHVYRVGDDGIKPMWRGSGLAYPLIDALPLQFGDKEILCALHAGGSFLTGINPVSPLHIMAYHWNGFGFSAERSKEAIKICNAHFENYLITSH